MARLQFSPASPVSQMSGSNSSVWSGCNRGGGGGGGGGGEGGGAEKLVSDIESLLHRSPDESFSDVSIYVEGKRVHAHRCILAVRCPYFRSFFSAAAAKEREGREDNTAAAATASVMEVKLETVMRGEKVGYEAFMAVMSYVYGSGTKEFAFCVSCFDSSCPHVTCRPAIEFVLEILRASSVLEISDLKAAAQQHLVNVVTYTQVDEVLLILAVAETHQVAQLYTMCLQVIASSDLDTLTLEKELSRFAMGEVMDQRLKLGLPGSAMDSLQLKQCKRIYRALDLDDVELVQMLLREEGTTIDRTYGLHYAAMYCDPKIVADLLKLEIAGTNVRNQRGFTVLHVAALRREPQTIGALLAKGAHVRDVTPDGRTALQISRRLGKKTDGDVDDEYNKDRLSIDILEQAGKKFACSKPTADVLSVTLSSEKELHESLSYLENRVSLGRLLFPQQLKIVLGISQLGSTPEFCGLDNRSSPSGFTSGSRYKKHTVDLNEMPARTQAGDETKTTVNEAQLERFLALRRTVEVGHKIFPNCARVIDTYVVDDEVLDLSEKAVSEEQVKKKRRLAELNFTLAEAFLRDMGEIDKQTTSGEHSIPMSSTSSTSSTITECVGNLINKL